MEFILDLSHKYYIFGYLLYSKPIPCPILQSLLQNTISHNKPKTLVSFILYIMTKIILLDLLLHNGASNRLWYWLAWHQGEHLFWFIHHHQLTTHPLPTNYSPYIFRPVPSHLRSIYSVCRLSIILKEYLQKKYFYTFPNLFYIFHTPPNSKSNSQSPIVKFQAEHYSNTGARQGGSSLLCLCTQEP